MCELLVYFCVKLSDCFSVARCTLSAAARRVALCVRLEWWDVSLWERKGAVMQKRCWEQRQWEKDQDSGDGRGGEREKIPGRWLDSRGKDPCMLVQSADRRVCVCVHVHTVAYQLAYVTGLLVSVYRGRLVIFQACHLHPPHILTQPTDSHLSSN